MTGIEIQFLNGVAILKFLDSDDIIFEYEKYRTPYDLMEAINSTVEYFMNIYKCDMLVDFEAWKVEIKEYIDKRYNELDDRMLKAKILDRVLDSII